MPDGSSTPPENVSGLNTDQGLSGSPQKKDPLNLNKDLPPGSSDSLHTGADQGLSGSPQKKDPLNLNKDLPSE